MLIQFQEYLTVQNIYLWINFGVLPFWLMLILIPNSKITLILVNSIILPVIFSTTYVYLTYQAIILDKLFFEFFKFYLSLEGLYTLFANENFLVIFWVHFIFINLFLGSWVSRDAVKYNIPKGIVVIPMLLIYFSGPLGLLLYWFFRIFYAKKLGFHD